LPRRISGKQFALSFDSQRFRVLIVLLSDRADTFLTPIIGFSLIIFGMTGRVEFNSGHAIFPVLGPNRRNHSVWRELLKRNWAGDNPKAHGQKKLIAFER
jgi:hypothetical protein